MSLEILLDTANLNEIKRYSLGGATSGLTTNQKIFLAEKGATSRSR